MVAVITGDITNSRKRENPLEWLHPLKDCLNRYGSTPLDWEIFRGDSFQLVVESPSRVLSAAFHIKANLLSISDLDVRLSIGVGEVSHRAKKVTESNGSAFVNSGTLFDELKSGGKTLGLITQSEEINEWVEPTLALARVIADAWTPGTARVIAAQLAYPDYSQTQLGNVLGMSQAAVSKALKRGHFMEVMHYANFLGKKLNN